MKAQCSYPGCLMESGDGHAYCETHWLQSQLPQQHFDFSNAGGYVSPAPVQQTAKQAVEAWWLDISCNDCKAATAKMDEYGSLDLVDIGRSLEQMAGHDGMTDAEHAELGVAFYVLGKVSRLMEAYRSGKQPSDDTWHDITVYSMMARRIRSEGKWG